MKKVVMLLFLLLGSFNVMATPVNVNTADAATIAAGLHGIGMKKAQEIVKDREKNGAFKTLEDLGRVKGIGDKTLAKNKADILFDGAGASPAAAAPAPAAAAPAVSAPTVAVPAAEKTVKDAKASVANPLK